MTVGFGFVVDFAFAAIEDLLDSIKRSQTALEEGQLFEWSFLGLATSCVVWMEMTSAYLGW